jgi:putative toxin-antitoxin system antitoxin component (TIGR02293 family)
MRAQTYGVKYKIRRDKPLNFLVKDLEGRIIEMAEVTKLGLEVFGNSEKLLLWLNTPNYAFGNLMPKELLKDSYGKEMVIAEFTRINHGILV